MPCPILSGSYQIACEAELKLFTEVLDARVTRECHLLSGGRSCSYRIEATD